MSEFRSVSYSPYQLNFKTGNTRSGALLRFEFEDSVGFSDCHPWPEFGDEPLEQQIKKLSQNSLTKLTERSAFLAHLDSQARREQKNLLADLDIPRSHFLVTTLDSLNDERLNELWNEGFRELKLKLGRNLETELERLNSIFVQSKSFHLRFDFNGLPQAEQLKNFLAKLELSIYSQIEYIEDPVGLHPQEWFELQDGLGVTFARDLVDVPNSEAHYFVRVAKPAVQDVFMLLKEEPESVEMVVTSYMDHPVGQVGAAYIASLLHNKIPDRCLLPGLLHHHVYEKNPYSEFLTQRGPKFQIVEGTGFGFDQLLAREQWKKL